VLVNSTRESGDLRDHFSYLRNVEIMNNPLGYEFYPGGFWFRIFGYGLTIVNRKTNPPLFSSRYGYRKSINIFHYEIILLNKL
jgi:hypothetical protein